MCQAPVDTGSIPVCPEMERIKDRTAVTFTVTCLGNSVSRVGLVGYYPVSEALIERHLPDREVLVFPLPPRVRDAIESALAQANTGVCYSSVSVCDGFCRHLGEGVTQFTVWRSE